MAIWKRNAVEEASDGGENAIANKETEGLSQGQIVFRRFVRHKAAMISLFTITFLIVAVFTSTEMKLGPLRWPGWWKFKFDELLELQNEGCPEGIVGCPTLDMVPSFIDGTGMGLGRHPFGQDDIGRDYFSLVMKGAQRSVYIMIVIGLMGGTIGTVIGALSGYFRGLVDSVLMRFTDFIITVPAIIIGSVIGYHYGNLGVGFLGFYLGLFAWTGLARLVRGEFFKLRELEFVDAARVAGASNRRIIFKHILPNAVGVIIVSVTLLMSGAILLETALSYLGFGVVAPDVSLGSLISQYQDSFTTRPWLFWWPGLFIITIALCINFIGDGLRDAFDPRQRRRLSKKDKAQARSQAKVAAQSE
jgi:ABC-type dipeptide/oligopeptide/nickel transport system permease subunit